MASEDFGKVRRHLSACFEARIADFAFLPNSATPACVSLPPIFRPQFGESRFNNLPREADVTLTCPSISQRLLSRSNLAFRIAKPVLRFSHLPPAYTHLSLSQRTLRSCRSTRQSINHPHHRLSLSPPTFTQTITPARYFSLPSRCSSSWTFRNYLRPPHPASCAHNNLLPCSASDRNFIVVVAGTLASPFGPHTWKKNPLVVARPPFAYVCCEDLRDLREMVVRTGFDSSRKLQHSVLGLASRL